MTREEFIAYCRTFLGLPYIWGADGPNAYDCSGLAQALLRAINLDPPGDQSAAGLFDYFIDAARGERLGAPPDIGYLVFYGKSSVSHVAVGIGGADIIEAGGGGRTTTSIQIAREQNAAVRIRPYNRRSDLYAIIRPLGLPW